MFSLSTFSLLLSAASTLAIPSHQLPNHNELAKRVEGTLSKRYTAHRVTWYPTNTGPDACTGKNHGDYDNIVALNAPQFGNTGNGNCGRKIKITSGGVTAYGVIQDKCATCYNVGEIDLTKGLFQKFANLDKGVFEATWSFADGDEEDPAPPPPKTTKKATTTKATTKATPTPTTQKAKPATTSTKKETHTPELEHPATTKKAAATTKKEAEHTEPTEAPAAAAAAFTGDDDNDEDCEEYEDDEEEEQEEPVHTPVKSTPTTTQAKFVPEATTPAIEVDSTPSSVVAVSSSSVAPVTTIATTSSLDAPVNPGAAPTTTAGQDPDSISGGINSDPLSSKNGATSLGYNKIVPGVVALFFLTVQAL